jgi:hypothetical protein
MIAPSSIRYSGRSSCLTSAIDASPPEAMTGIVVARASSAVAGRLRPFSTPSRSMSV